MMGNSRNDKRCLYRDRHFQLALLIAPVFWLCLYAFDTTHASLDWVLISPWLFVSLVLMQPVVEEIVFRGALQGWLIKKSWAQVSYLNMTWANVLTSVAFVAMHLFYHAPWMALSVIIPSLLFGYFRDRYQGWLIPCVGLHCFYNLGYFFLYSPIAG